MGRARSVLELDLDPDVTIGLGLPMRYDDVKGFFSRNFNNSFTDRKQH